MSKNKLGNNMAYLVANKDRLITTPEDRKAFKKLKKKFSRHCRNSK